MLKEIYRYFVAVCMVFTLYNVHKTYGSHYKICTPAIRLRGPHEQGICGDRIPEVLETYCFLGYNARGKREVAKVKEQLKLDAVKMSREDANTYLVDKRTNYHDTGIVCECCYHACDVGEIYSYCLSDFRKRGLDILKRTQPMKSTVKQQLHEDQED
ncbi:hypothetical protein ACF0H5_023350 [Mactra antiquata]